MGLFGGKRKARAQASDSIDVAAAAQDTRVELLQASYREVLDATKHQDDKVGRLLTATAFLTAAALSLANLAGEAIPRQFSVGGEDLPPLALLAVGGFLVAVVLVVVMLVFSVTTPLKIPVFSDPNSPYKRRFSQIYFYSIADASEDEWKEKWARSESESLREELVGMYVRETHNLAIRADFKYARTNEGVALLTFGLLAFASAVVFVLSGLTSPCPGPASGTACTRPIELTEPFRYTLGGVTATWLLSSLITQLRAGRLQVANLVGLWRTDGRPWPWFRATAGRVFVLTGSTAAFLAIAFVPRTFVGISTNVWTLVLEISALAALLITQVTSRPKVGSRWTSFASFLAMGVALVAAIVFTLRAAGEGSYSSSLIAGYCFPVGVFVSSLVAPSAALADRRAKFRAP